MSSSGQRNATPPPLGAENYQLGPEISTGGMGSVLEAHDGKLKRTVAIKVMLLEANANPSMRQRFIREAEVLAMLAHPNIVPIYDIVWEDGLPLFYSMKLVRGRTLQAVLTDLRKEVPEALREYTLDRLLLIFRKVCDAVAFAHSKGVLHRDLKPDNIMVGEFGEVLVMDWGLASVTQVGRIVLNPPREGVEPAEASLNERSPLACDGGAERIQRPTYEAWATLAGAVLGTPQYMSPEQARGSMAEVDELSDIYALGGILYAILTLRPPIEGKTALEVLRKVSRGEIVTPTALQTQSGSKGKSFEKGGVLEAKHIKPLPHVRGGRVPAALSSVTMKALQRERAERYANVTSLSTDIDAYMNGFATMSEQASTLRQIQLLMLRHKVVTTSLAVLLLTSLGFVWKVMASERRAQQSLATAQNALADIAFKSGDITNMTIALNAVPTGLRDQSWHYLSKQRDSSLGPLMIPGFCERVSDVCAVPQAPALFAIASRDGRIGIVDVVGRKLLRTIDTGHPGEVRLSISGDGSRLLTRTSSAKEAVLYDLATGSKLRSFPVSPSSDTAHPVLQTLALNGSGKLAAIADFDRTELHLIDTATGVVRWTKPFRPMQMAFHPDGRRLFLIRHEHYDLAMLNVSDGSLGGHVRLNAHPNSMALSPDGHHLIVGLISGELERIEGGNGLQKLRRRIASMPIAQVAFSAGGNVITLGGSGSQSFAVSRTLSLWQAGDLIPAGSFFGITNYRGYWPLSMNHSSGHILTQQSPPQLWHIDDRPIATPEPGGDAGWSCHFLSDTLLLTREGGFCTRRDLSNPRTPIPLDPFFAEGHTVSAVHRASGLVATAYSRNSTATPGSPLSLWQFTPAGVTNRWSRPAETGSDGTMHLDFDVEGGRLLRTTPGGQLIVHDVRTGEPLLTLQHDSYKAVFAGAHGHIIAISSELSADNTHKGNVVILDPRDGRILASLDHDTGFYALATSPDRRLIAVAGSDRFVMILDAETLAVRHRFRAHDGIITAACFHPTEPLLATGSTDSTIKLWHYPDARLLRTFSGTEGHPRSIAISPDCRLLATDGRDRHIRIFELEPREAHPTVAAPAADIDLEKGIIGDTRIVPIGFGQEVRLKYIPGGDFLMGSPATEAGHSDDENQVKVTLSSHCWMSETEATLAQWQAFMHTSPSHFDDNPNLPVENVSHDRAVVFIAKLNAAVSLPAGWRWSLPTEAQWEHACRAGTQTAFYFGNNLNAQQASFQSNPWLQKTVPVKSFPPNAYGLYDMHGSVVEWCVDWYADTLAGGIDPRGPDTGHVHGHRGGAWNRYSRLCRSAARTTLAADFPHDNLGVRLVIVRSDPP